MIVVHNNGDPKEVSPLINSTIVKSDGMNPTAYNAYSVKSTVTWPDPAAYNESKTMDVNNLRDARNDVVNHAKVPDIAIGTPSSTLLKYVSKSGETNLLITSPFGNWREFSTNGFCSISERVLLNPDALIMKNGVTYNVDNMKSLLSGTSIKGHTLSGILKGATSLINAVGEVADVETAEKGEYISKFQNVPVADPSKVVTSGLDSLKFTFKFGQAQLYSAEEEVVKPILAMANIFMPRQNKNSNRITTPFMSQIRAKTHIMAACLGSLKDGGLKDLLGSITDTPTGQNIRDNGLSGGGQGGGFVNNVVGKANEITSKVFEGIDNAAKKALDETVTILLNIGGYVTGPYVATQVNWDFDFNDVDEYGYPCKGEITLGGLKMIFVNCSDDALRQWGYNTDGTGDNPFAGNSTISNTVNAAYSDGKAIVGAKTKNTQGA